MSASREKKLRKEAQARGPDMTAREKQKRQDAFRRAVVITISAVVLFALITLIVVGSGVMPANMTVLTIDGVRISGAEFDYHYFSAFYRMWEMYESMGILEWLGIDPNRSFRRQDMGDGTSWAEYFEGAAVQSLTDIIVQSEAARREGIALTQEDIDGINDNIDYVERLAAANSISPDRLLRNQFGRGMNMRAYRTIMERLFLANRYETVTTEAFGFTNDDFEAFYAENRDSYDYIDYHAFTLADQEKAEEMLARVTTSGAFWALSREYAEAEEDNSGDTGDDGNTNDDNGGGDDDGGNGNGNGGYNGDNGYNGGEEEEEIDDDTLFEKRSVSSISAPIAEFLTDGSRRAGDKAIAEGEDEFIVLLFLRRYRDETISAESIDVRHILISTERGEFAGDTEGALERAEEILRQWKDGDADEEYFAELARENSADGNAAAGGIYEEVPPGRMVATFNDWCFDPVRKPGDTGIVETQFGFHIMYFVRQHGEMLPDWLREVMNDKNNEVYGAHREELAEKAGEPKRSWVGMLFTKSKSA